MRRFIVEKQDTATTTTDADDYTESEYNYTEDFSTNSASNTVQMKLKDLIPLKTMSEKKYLTSLPYYKTWVSYINNKTKQFRPGGLLVKTSYPDYIMLKNIPKNAVWSVQLKDNTIYVKDPKVVAMHQAEQKKKEQIKEKLYELYESGKLVRK
jgi:hypothetical protein